MYHLTDLIVQFGHLAARTSFECPLMFCVAIFAPKWLFFVSKNIDIWLDFLVILLLCILLLLDHTVCFLLSYSQIVICAWYVKLCSYYVNYVVLLHCVLLYYTLYHLTGKIFARPLVCWDYIISTKTRSRRRFGILYCVILLCITSSICRHRQSV